MALTRVYQGVEDDDLRGSSVHTMFAGGALRVERSGEVGVGFLFRFLAPPED